jgi:hypothetical protein
VRHEDVFKIFDSGGGWLFLFGKLLQTTFGVMHNHKRDIVKITVGDAKATLANQRGELQ